MNSSLHGIIDQLADSIEPSMIEWRRDFHKHPELGNREFRTSKIVAQKLREMGMEVKTGVAHTGVVALLKGVKEGPVVALRADMDALPVTEKTGLPYASAVTDEVNGEKFGVMHACGHDIHTATLLGAAKILSKMKDNLSGTVKFIFQPSEEGPPADEEGGAVLMIKEGVLKSPDVDVIFGLHVGEAPLGFIGYREGSILACGDVFEITVKGEQTHGGMPWLGKDAVTASAQIILGLQTIVSRELNLTEAAAVISICQINGGVKTNIIPEEVKIAGTIRSLDPEAQKQIHDKMERKARLIAQSMDMTAEMTITPGIGVTYNDPKLTREMVPTLERVGGKGMAIITAPKTASEDFSAYTKLLPALYCFLGATPPGEKPIVHHSPYFAPDERVIKLGIKTFCNLAVDYLSTH